MKVKVLVINPDTFEGALVGFNSGDINISGSKLKIEDIINIEPLYTKDARFIGGPFFEKLSEEIINYLKMMKE